MEWYGVEFHFFLNPFMVSKSLELKAEEMGFQLRGIKYTKSQLSKRKKKKKNGKRKPK
jgi:hypothetical protein